jgi:hypothetical protein
MHISGDVHKNLNITGSKLVKLLTYSAWYVVYLVTNIDKLSHFRSVSSTVGHKSDKFWISYGMIFEYISRDVPEKVNLTGWFSHCLLLCTNHCTSVTWQVLNQLRCDFRVHLQRCTWKSKPNWLSFSLFVTTYQPLYVSNLTSFEPVMVWFSSTSPEMYLKK